MPRQPCSGACPEQAAVRQDLHETVISPLMTYLKTHNPDCIERCAMARAEMEHRRRMQSVDVPGLGEISIDLSKVKTTLIDINFGRNWKTKKSMGSAVFGGEFGLVTKNFVKLRLSLFGGEFEVSRPP